MEKNTNLQIKNELLEEFCAFGNYLINSKNLFVTENTINFQSHLAIKAYITKTLHFKQNTLFSDYLITRGIPLQRQINVLEYLNKKKIFAESGIKNLADEEDFIKALNANKLSLEFGIDYVNENMNKIEIISLNEI